MKKELISEAFLRELAKKRIYKCKESAYGKNTTASNVSEGDYGTWDNWQQVLEDFAKEYANIKIVETLKKEITINEKTIEINGGSLSIRGGANPKFTWEGEDFKTTF